jgi:hypothetical protein
MNTLQTIAAGCALTSALAFLSPALAQGASGKSDLAHALVGTWRVTSYAQFDVAMNKALYPIGKEAIGYMQFSPGGHVVVFITASKRVKPKAPFTDADLAAIMRDMGSAYMGTYRLDGNKLTVHEVTALRADNIGTDQVRFVTLDGNHLMMKNAPSINGKTGRNTITEISAEREE